MQYSAADMAAEQAGVDQVRWSLTDHHITCEYMSTKQHAIVTGTAQSQCTVHLNPSRIALKP